MEEGKMWKERNHGWGLVGETAFKSEMDSSFKAHQRPGG